MTEKELKQILEEERQRVLKEIKEWVKTNTHNFRGPVDIDGLLDTKDFLEYLDSIDTKLGS